MISKTYLFDTEKKLWKNLQNILVTTGPKLWVILATKFEIFSKLDTHLKQTRSHLLQNILAPELPR